MTLATHPKSSRAGRTRSANRVIILLGFVGLVAIAAAALRNPRTASAPAAPAALITAQHVPAPKARASKSRSFVGGLTFLTVTVTLSLLATSGSYALWNGKTVINGSSLNTGNIALTVNTVTSYTLTMPTTALAPGKSVLATATVANAGTVPISASVESTTITANTNNLASSLTLTISPVASAGACAIGVSGGTTAALTSFNTTSAPYAMPAGASQIVCFELKLDNAAPASEQGGSTTFRLNLVANQTRP
jgi:hypothetical protein